MTHFFLFRRTNLTNALVVCVTRIDADDMDAAIDRVIPHYASGSSDIDCISNDCTMFADESGDVVVEYALVEARDYCAHCNRDYDAMDEGERAAHVIDGEYVIGTCDAGAANGVVWS